MTSVLAIPFSFFAVAFELEDVATLSSIIEIRAEFGLLTSAGVVFGDAPPPLANGEVDFGDVKGGLNDLELV